jgi:dTDP-4-amino-4,6-dideoxygalactose transaminase
MPAFPTSGAHAWQAFVTYVDPASAPRPRNEIMERLEARGVATRPGTHAIHMLGYYRQRYSLAPDDYPAARACHDHTMAIPLHNRLSPDDYAHVVDSVRTCC